MFSVPARRRSPEGRLESYKMRVKFSDLFSEDANGDHMAKKPVKVVAKGATYNGAQGSVAAFSAICLGKPSDFFCLGDLVGNDLEVEDQGGTQVIKGYYAADGQLRTLA